MCAHVVQGREQVSRSAGEHSTCTTTTHTGVRQHQHGMGHSAIEKGAQHSRSLPAARVHEAFTLCAGPMQSKPPGPCITPAAPCTAHPTCQQQRTSASSPGDPSPVTLLSVHTCCGIALGCVLQQSRLPQQVWPGLQHDLVAASPHTRPAWQQAWFCSQWQQQVQEDGEEEEEQKRTGSVPGCCRTNNQYKQMQPCLPAWLLQATERVETVLVRAVCASRCQGH